jgi:hypothetical protein
MVTANTPLAVERTGNVRTLRSWANWQLVDNRCGRFCSGAADVPEGVVQVAAECCGAGRCPPGSADAAVVHHCAQSPLQSQSFPLLTRAVLDGAAEAGSALVFADDL